jgi:hypothetical protein
VLVRVRVAPAMTAVSNPKSRPPNDATAQIDNKCLFRGPELSGMYVSSEFGRALNHHFACAPQIVYLFRNLC